MRLSARAALEERLQSIGRVWKDGHDGRNRRFVAGVCYLLRTGLPWADLPAEFGNCDAVRKRFRRWCKAGIWQCLFKGTVPVEQVGKLMLDGTICKAHRSAAGARGGAEEDIGRSRGGLTTKLGAAVCATTQKIVRVVLAPGQRNDCVLAAAMLGPIEGATVIADKAFDTDPIRNHLAARGCTAVIPPKTNRRHPKKLSKALPLETWHRECVLPDEGSDSHHPAPRQNERLLRWLPPPRLRRPQYSTQCGSDQEWISLSVDPSGE
jgi:transposase